MYLGIPSRGIHPSGYSSWSSSSGGWNVYVRQGAAVYPLAESSVAPALGASAVKLLKSLSSSNHVLFDVPVGTINVTTAREALRYEPHTLPVLVTFIKDRVQAFQKELSSHIGDASNYRDALKNLASARFKSTQAPSFQSLHELLPLMEFTHDTIVKNYETFFSSLPDIPKSVVKYDSLGEAVRDPAGGLVYDTVMVRPQRMAPQLLTRMRKSDFPEGKVLLHTGTLYADAKITIRDSALDEINIGLPNVVYVIPNHMPSWQDRIRSHVATAFKDQKLPQGESNGVKVYIIRCAKRKGVRLEDFHFRGHARCGRRYCSTST
jgi:hypothetical protein